MASIWEKIVTFFSSAQTRTYLFAALVLLAGLLFARLLSRRLKLNRLHPQHRMLVRRAIVYLVVLTTVMWSLRLLGVGM
ncbi:MAG: hypothetical protein KC503_27285, partial [Myxococcales bacterium]|nr:hypothetical protein [Myxococcales bacterium]